MKPSSPKTLLATAVMAVMTAETAFAQLEEVVVTAGGDGKRLRGLGELAGRHGLRPRVARGGAWRWTRAAGLEPVSLSPSRLELLFL